MRFVAGAAAVLACALAAEAAAASAPRAEGSGATGASGAVTVMGRGPARECSDAARRGASDTAAEQLCTAALEGQPMSARNRAGTYVNRGVIRLRRGAYDLALADFDTAIRAQPAMAEAHLNRGAAGIGGRRFAQSVADLTRALELGAPEPHKAYYNRAVAHEWLENPKAAYLDYVKALELAPDWPLVREQLARFTLAHPDVR